MSGHGGNNAGGAAAPRRQPRQSRLDRVCAAFMDPQTSTSDFMNQVHAGHFSDRFSSQGPITKVILAKVAEHMKHQQGLLSDRKRKKLVKLLGKHLKVSRHNYPGTALAKLLGQYPILKEGRYSIYADLRVFGSVALGTLPPPMNTPIRKASRRRAPRSKSRRMGPADFAAQPADAQAGGAARNQVAVVDAVEHVVAPHIQLIKRLSEGGRGLHMLWASVDQSRTMEVGAVDACAAVTGCRRL
jgi:hypothetical protein